MFDGASYRGHETDRLLVQMTKRPTIFSGISSINEAKLGAPTM